MQISQTLTRFGASKHLPTWHSRDDNAIWVDFVAGEPCRHVNDAQLPAIATCLESFAMHRSRLIPLDRTGYWQQHRNNLDYLCHHQLGDQRLHDELTRRSDLARPALLRLGFDYRDPIGPNLLRRRDSNTICAIDVKNLHGDTMVGEGLAKASDRWLCADRRRYVFARLAAAGLADVEHHFEFIHLYERTTRARRKVERDLKLHQRIRSYRSHCAKLESALD